MEAKQRVVLLGGTSQLGFAMVQRFGTEALTPFCSGHSRHPACADWPRVNLDDTEALQGVLRDGQPDMVIHCAGICDVAKCEEQPDHAWKLNVNSMTALLDALPRTTRLVYCSSDHVFGGDQGPYRESDPTHPISIYGETRCAAEAMVTERRGDALIVRHGLGIGTSASGKSGHLDWLRYRTRQGLPTTVIFDEVRSAVWSEDLADRLWALAHSDISGIRHITATTAAARGDLARHLDRLFDIGATLTEASRHDQGAPHIGNVELATEYTGPLAQPLQAVIHPNAMRSVTDEPLGPQEAAR